MTWRPRHHQGSGPLNRYFGRDTRIAMVTEPKHAQQFVDAGFQPLRRATVMKLLRDPAILLYIDSLDVPVCRIAFRNRMRRQ